jgi:hypothetical protein
MQEHPSSPAAYELQSLLAGHGGTADDAHPEFVALTFLAERYPAKIEPFYVYLTEKRFKTLGHIKRFFVALVLHTCAVATFQLITFTSNARSS